MTKIYITRHGETAWNIERRMQGQQDSQLTQLGEKQAGWLSKKLIDVQFDAIYCSSLGRAINTAEIIRGDKDVEIFTCHEFREMSLGKWEGMLISEVEKIYPIQHDYFWNKPHHFQPNEGENFKQLIERASKKLEDILVNHRDETLLIVSHAVTLKALFAYIEKKELADFWSGPFLKSTCLTIVEHNGAFKEIEVYGDTSHYEYENDKGMWFFDENK